jgi:uncharacterized damage-inducible protein DinB
MVTPNMTRAGATCPLVFPKKRGPAMPELPKLLDQIVFARQYTLRLLEDLPQAKWFQMPSEGVTHVAWQLGHLAMSEYRLVLERVRGPRPEDIALISPEFLALFRRQSQPYPDASRYPSAQAIRSVFDRVHDHVLRELPGHPEEDLATELVDGHHLARNKREALSWCAAHELVHAGQIGLLRRLLGHPALW